MFAVIQKFYSNLAPKEKKLFYIAGGIVVLLLFDALFIRPVISKLNIIRDEISEKENSIKKDLRLLAYSDRILRERAVFKRYQTTQVQTSEEIIAGFLKTIEMLAKKSSINLIKLNPAESKQKIGYVNYYANLECDGKLEDVIKFIHMIDSTENLLKVVQMNIAAAKASADSVSAAMTVSKIVLDAQSGNIEGDENLQAREDMSAQPMGNGSGAAAPGQGTPEPSDELKAGTPLAQVIPEGASAPSGAAGAGDNNAGTSPPTTGPEGTGTGAGTGTGNNSTTGAAGPAVGSGASGGPGTAANTTGNKGGSGTGNNKGNNAGSGMQSQGIPGTNNDIEIGGPDKSKQAQEANQGQTEEKTNDESKKKPEWAEKIDVTKQSTGRVRVKGLDTVWEDFWGNFVKKKPEPKKQKAEKIDPKDVEPPKPNLWERVLSK